MGDTRMEEERGEEEEEGGEGEGFAAVGVTVPGGMEDSMEDMLGVRVMVRLVASPSTHYKTEAFSYVLYCTHIHLLHSCRFIIQCCIFRNWEDNNIC